VGGEGGGVWGVNGGERIGGGGGGFGWVGGRGAELVGRRKVGGGGWSGRGKVVKVGWGEKGGGRGRDGGTPGKRGGETRKGTASSQNLHEIIQGTSRQAVVERSTKTRGKRDLVTAWGVRPSLPANWEARKPRERKPS